MASTSNLSVIISGQTDPLAKALKKAEKDISNFKQHSELMGGITRGFGVGVGMFGVDNLLKSIKKSAGPELKEALESAEGVAGRFVTNFAKLDSWLPGIVNSVNHIASKQNIDQGWQEWAEEVESLRMKFIEFESDTNIRKRVEAMREEYNAQVQAGNFQKEMLAYEERRKKVAEDRAKAFQTETDTYIAKLRSERDSLDPDKDTKDAQKFKSTGDPFKDAEIGLLQMQVAELKKQKQAQEELKLQQEEQAKLKEQELHRFEQAQKMMEHLADDRLKFQEGELALQLKNLAALGATKDMLAQYRKEYEELEFMKMEDEFWKAFDEAAMDKADATKKPKEGKQYAGAMEAGSEAAYSAIVNAASAADVKKPIEKQTKVAEEVLAVNKQIRDKQGDATKIVDELKRINAFKVITFGS